MSGFQATDAKELEDEEPDISKELAAKISRVGSLDLHKRLLKQPGSQYDAFPVKSNYLIACFQENL
jgi:hypothetical protein